MAKKDMDVLWTEVFGSKIGLPQFYDKEGNPVVISQDNPMPVQVEGSYEGGGSMRFLFGETEPDASIGEPGDVYLNTENGDFYQNQNGNWNLKANLRGPQGEQGPQGERGPQGEQGPAGKDAEPQFTQEQVNALLALIDEEGA